MYAVTTQNEALRKRFPGVPGDIVTYFGFVAQEVRHILAKLGMLYSCNQQYRTKLMIVCLLHMCVYLLI